MEFQKRYTTLEEKDKGENKDKKVISNDAFAIGDMIQELINNIEHTRSSLMR